MVSAQKPADNAFRLASSSGAFESSEAPSRGITYEMALRAIGQDLATLVVDSLEIVPDSEAFIARGHCVAFRSGTAEDNRNLWKKTWEELWASKHRMRSRESVLEPFLRSYGPEDIRRLDDIGRLRRGHAAILPKASDLADMLRTIGRIVDLSGGRFIKLNRTRDRSGFEYQDAHGALHREEFVRSELFRAQLEGIVLRGSTNKKDPWEQRDL
jgi:hypothetical protein